MSDIVSGDSEVVKTIPLDDIVAGAIVRLTEIDGVQYLSIRDIIMHVCGRDCHGAAQTWRLMSDDKVSSLGPFLNIFRFPGRGQVQQPVITFPGAIKMLMFLPGAKAKTHYSSMVSILTRYFTGDPSLLE